MKHYIKPELTIGYLDSEVLLAGSGIENGGDKGDNWESESRERNSFFDGGWSEDK